MDTYLAETLRHDYEQDLRDDLIELGFEDEDKFEDDSIDDEPETAESEGAS
jgi:hypothetical protein